MGCDSLHKEQAGAGARCAALTWKATDKSDLDDDGRRCHRTHSETGVRDTTQKILQHVRSIFRFAQAKGLRTDNPAEPVVEILERAPDVIHHAALLTFPELGDVLRRAEVAAVTHGVWLTHRLIDLSLDHVHASDVALAYDRGQRPAKRVALMAWWGPCAGVG